MNKKQNPQGSKMAKPLSGKLLDKFKIRILDQEFIIELYNQDTTDENCKIYTVLVNDNQYSVEVEKLDFEDTAPSELERESRDSLEMDAELPDKRSTRDLKPAPFAKPVGLKKKEVSKDQIAIVSGKTLTAPMPGKILEIKTSVGDQVEAGQPLVILEAMKMENVMTAPASGTVEDIPIKIGINVNQGDVLVVIT